MNSGLAVILGMIAGLVQTFQAKAEICNHGDPICYIAYEVPKSLSPLGLEVDFQKTQQFLPTLGALGDGRPSVLLTYTYHVNLQPNANLDDVYEAKSTELEALALSMATRVSALACSPDHDLMGARLGQEQAFILAGGAVIYEVNIFSRARRDVHAPTRLFPLSTVTVTSCEAH